MSGADPAALQIRPICLSDCVAIAVLERQNPHPWRQPQIVEELRRPHGFQLAGEIAGAILGFVMGTLVAGEAEILRLAVDADHRRRGIGGRLLGGALDWLAANGASTCWLEVRRSNDAGRRLYENAGFRPVGHRKNYYRDPVEDAVLMTRTLTSRGSQ